MNFIQRFNGFNPGPLFARNTRVALCCLLAFAALSGQVLEAGSKPPEIAMRFHLQASPGMPKEQIVAVSLIDPPQGVYVRRLPEMTEKHLESVQKMEDGRILIVFNTVGANLLEAATRSNMGAIMVVICNGRVVYAPVIDVPLASGRIILPGGISDQEIAAFQKMIARKKKT